MNIIHCILLKLDRLHSHYPVSNFLMIWLSQMIIIIFSLQSSFWCQHHHDNWRSSKWASFIAFIASSLNWIVRTRIIQFSKVKSSPMICRQNWCHHWCQHFWCQNHQPKLGQLSQVLFLRVHVECLQHLTRRFTFIIQSIHGHKKFRKNFNLNLISLLPIYCHLQVINLH